MKRFLAFVFAFLLLLSPAVLAHSGGTDANGGHYDRSPGNTTTTTVIRHTSTTT